MPGQKLHHQQLSERLGVSRTPVREALTRLVQEGYVSFLPNRGFTCKEIRMQEAEELYDLREALEAFAVEKAIDNLTDSALRGVAPAAESLRPRRAKPLHPRALGVRSRRPSSNRPNRRQRDLEKYVEPCLRAHRAQAPHRRHLRSGARARRPIRNICELLEAMERRDARSGGRHRAQPYPSRQEKCHGRPASSAKRSASSGLRNLIRTEKHNRRKGKLWQQI